PLANLLFEMLARTRRTSKPQHRPCLQRPVLVRYINIRRNPEQVRLCPHPRRPIQSMRVIPHRSIAYGKAHRQMTYQVVVSSYRQSRSKVRNASRLWRRLIRDRRVEVSVIVAHEARTNREPQSIVWRPKPKTETKRTHHDIPTSFIRRQRTRVRLMIH